MGFLCLLKKQFLKNFVNVYTCVANKIKPKVKQSLSFRSHAGLDLAKGGGGAGFPRGLRSSSTTDYKLFILSCGAISIGGTYWSKVWLEVVVVDYLHFSCIRLNL